MGKTARGCDGLNLFFSPHSRPFCSCLPRQSTALMADLGRVEPLRKVLRQKLRWGEKKKEFSAGERKKRVFFKDFRLLQQRPFLHRCNSMATPNCDIVRTGTSSLPRFFHTLGFSALSPSLTESFRKPKTLSETLFSTCFHVFCTRSPT